jgi:iron complex transport system ATP-binding protein
MLKADALTITLQGKDLVKNVSHTFKPGIITAIIGRNGAGKSSLLKALTNLWQATSGQVRIDGHDIKKWPPTHISKKISFVRQEVHAPFYFTAEEMVSMGTYALEIKDKSLIKNISYQALEKVNLLSLKKAKFTHLSQGERARVLIARALAMQTAIILLDEPMAHLDIQQQKNMWQLLKNLANEGKSIIVAAHDLHSIEKYSEELILLCQGEVQYQGATHTFFLQNSIERYFF